VSRLDVQLRSEARLQCRDGVSQRDHGLVRNRQILDVVIAVELQDLPAGR